MTKLVLGDITIDVLQKNIKNVHLSVHPPQGQVRISAPSRMNIDTIRLYAISKLDWIKSQQTQLRKQEREPKRDYVERESHYVWGKRYLLQIREIASPASVQLVNRHLILSVRPGTSETKCHAIVEAWYRGLVREEVTTLIKKWEPIVGVKVKRIFVQKMKTRWGSCSPATGSIRINVDLGRKPINCLEYIVVHELVHFLEQRHNERFRFLMDRLLPSWQHCRRQLNSAPLSHVDWNY